MLLAVNVSLSHSHLTRRDSKIFLSQGVIRKAFYVPKCPLGVISIKTRCHHHICLFREVIISLSELGLEKQTELLFFFSSFLLDSSERQRNHISSCVLVPTAIGLDNLTKMFKFFCLKYIHAKTFLL